MEHLIHFGKLIEDFFPIDISLFLVLISFVVLILILNVILKKTIKTIPSVKGGLPFFGHVFTMIHGSPWDTMTRWVHEYGTIFKFHLFGSDAICVSDPEFLKIILSTKLSVFKKDTKWTYKPFMVLLGNGLVTADGLSWRNQRVLLSHHLRFDILEEIPQMALDAVRRLCVKLDKAKETGTAIDMAEQFRHLTLQVIAEAILSLSAEESDVTFAHMYLPIVEEGNLRTWSPQRMYLPTPSYFKFLRDVEKLNSYVSGLIEKRWLLKLEERDSGKPVNRRKDVLDKQLENITVDQWGPGPARQIRDEIKTFILAGHETSASMLTWTLYELTKTSNKQSLTKVLEESKAVFMKNSNSNNNSNSNSNGSCKIDSVPTKDRLSQLVYSECCLRESLRKYSVVPTVVRVASEDIDLGPHKLHQGTTLMVNIQGVHHNPNFWPEPLEYKPERFLGEIAPYTFIPFVEGPRMCLGQYLSLLETKIVLSILLNTFQFEVVNIEDAGLKHPFMVPIIPKAGHWMKVKGRIDQ